MMTNWLEHTAIANYEHPTIRALMSERGWLDQPAFDRVGAAYAFVKDEIPFGYNRADDLPASEVLADGYGQCNTKGNLLVALLRGLGLPARFHGFTIEKALQKGAIPWWLFPLAPARILHSWVEVRWGSAWLPLEGFILDRPYLASLQRRFPEATRFCGYGAATPDLQRPEVEWCGKPTYIQREGIADDFGVFDHPDDLYRARGTNLSGVRSALYVHVFRHAMNATVRRIRRSRSDVASAPKARAAEPA
ncbi:MAG: transglutaminase family protein [Myxococcota bacterium]